MVANYSRVAGENVGTYAISATLSPIPVLVNYDITYNTDNLSVTQKDINVVVDAGQGKVYGAADPALTSTNDALISPDTYTGSLHRALGESVGN